MTAEKIVHKTHPQCSDSALDEMKQQTINNREKELTMTIERKKLLEMSDEELVRHMGNLIYLQRSEKQNHGDEIQVVQDLLYWREMATQEYLHDIRKRAQEDFFEPGDEDFNRYFEMSDCELRRELAKLISCCPEDEAYEDSEVGNLMDFIGFIIHHRYMADVFIKGVREAAATEGCNTIENEYDDEYDDDDDEDGGGQEKPTIH